MVKGNTVVLGGEITSKADINYDQIVRRVAKKLGYRADKIINLISEQSPEINRAVLSDEDIGAGDQGIMFGYATRETASRLPYAFDVANRIIAALEDDADNIKITSMPLEVEFDSFDTLKEIKIPPEAIKAAEKTTK